MDQVRDTKYLKPFTTRYSSGVPDLLKELGCTLAISTYQAGKVVFISASNNSLVQIARSFSKPMGIALSEDNQRMALANLSEVVVFQNNSQLAASYPRKKQVYDAMYFPRASYHTNPLDIHDLHFIGDDLFAVNTMFSCIVKIDDRYSFTPVWKPDFISKIVSEDRCHLNGMTIRDNKIKFATAFSKTDTVKGWKENMLKSGVLIDVEKGHIIMDNLSLPHSPRWHEGNVYVALSGTGEIIKIQPDTARVDRIIQLDGFLRGMAFFRDYLFVAHSKIRDKSSSFGHLQLNPSKNAGIYIVDLKTNSLVGHIEYLNSVEEIYDVQIISKFMRPNILKPSEEEQLLGLSTPSATYWGQKKKA